jgi:hypothetical protein
MRPTDIVQKSVKPRTFETYLVEEEVEGEMHSIGGIFPTPATLTVGGCVPHA